MQIKFKWKDEERERRYGTFSSYCFYEGQPNAGVEDFFGLAEVESLRERLR
jgi:hypothetical protein